MDKEKEETVNNGSFIVGLLILMILGWIFMKTPVSATYEGKVRVDSVDFHPAYKDNISQAAPYWRYRLEKTNFFVSSLKEVKVGDSVTVIIKK